MQNVFQMVEYKEFEPMMKHTTFRIGGPARYFFIPKNTEEIRQLLSYCRKEKKKYMVLGNGSNMLFPDEGYDGIIIYIGGNMSEIRVEGTSLYAEAGALLSKTAVVAREHGLAGLEFAAGIPGTIGGAMVMNAGAYGGEMKDVVSSVDVLECDGTVRCYTGEEMKFGYRKSVIDADRIVLGARIKLKPGDRDAIDEEMNHLKEARLAKQPLEYPSAGSTFKRPEGYFAGKLIDDSGLRGYKVGGAMVSEKHCGFVINYDGATAEDVITLIEDVRQKVYEKYQVMLEPEVRIVR